MGWSTDFPTEPGYYWFYGCRDRWSQRKNDQRLTIIHVRTWGNGCVYIADGEILYRSEGLSGWWLPLPTPELPNLKNPLSSEDE